MALARTTIEGKIYSPELKNVNGKNLFTCQIGVHQSRKKEDGSWEIIHSEYIQANKWQFNQYDKTPETLAQNLKENDRVIAILSDLKVQAWVHTQTNKPVGRMVGNIQSIGVIPQNPQQNQGNQTVQASDPWGSQPDTGFGQDDDQPPF